jgi:hypothetical protein
VLFVSWLAALASFAIFGIAAASPDSDLPPYTLETIFQIACTIALWVIVWPLIIAGLLFGSDLPWFVMILLWIASCLLWGFIFDWTCRVVSSRRARRSDLKAGIQAGSQ